MSKASHVAVYMNQFLVYDVLQSVNVHNDEAF